MSTQHSSPTEIELLAAAAASDGELVDQLTDLVNRVYASAEDGLWVDDATRTTAPEMAKMIADGQIALARMDGQIVGSIRIQQLDSGEGEFGMLVADPARRGEGIGRDLVIFAEELSRRRGRAVMQLELLVPREWTHPTKEFLHAWYTRIGYRPVRSGTIDESYPQLAPLLATPCDFVVYHKDLESPVAPVTPPGRGRAVVLRRFGDPLAIEEFELPPAVDAGAMVVASRYGGVCGTDLHLQQGHLEVPTPLVLGHEGLGTVQELGPGVTHDATGAPLHAGDPIMWASSISCGQCVPCRMHGDPTLCEHRQTYGVNRPTTAAPALSGSWADYIYLRPGTTVVKLPESIDPLAAMSLACAGPTLVRALGERRQIRLGEVVVVQGSGPVGLAAAALAQISGAATVILAGGPAQRLDLAAEVGIGDHHVNVVESDDLAATLAHVVELTGGRGADLVVECTGVPAAVAQGLRLARRGGSYLVVGQYTDGGDTAINPHQIVYRRLDVVGSWAFGGAHLVRYVQLLPDLLERFDLGRLVTTYPLADHAAALADVAAGTIMKAVLVSGSR